MSTRIQMQPVQWTELNLIEEMEPISDNDFEILKELREVIFKHGYEDRFGVCLVHKHFDIYPGEIALETSDDDARVSTIRVVKEEEANDAWQTSWKFSRDIQEIKAGRNCRVYCKGFGLMGHTRKHECTAS